MLTPLCVTFLPLKMFDFIDLTIDSACCLWVMGPSVLMPSGLFVFGVGPDSLLGLLSCSVNPVHVTATWHQPGTFILSAVLLCQVIYSRCFPAAHVITSGRLLVKFVIKINLSCWLSREISEVSHVIVRGRQ